MRNTVVSPNVVLEDHVILNFYASCDYGAKIGKFCIFSPLCDYRGSPNSMKEYSWQLILPQLRAKRSVGTQR